ncbi:class A beta-lactamase [Methylocapsa sp. S129]|uniref:class A beta-lactamase n=1 Tax=Methylocapsa sp. S129 TaxID=1641869 RepID=UPI00131EB64E|nr:class A beta-lactamase [Methylocapsa sp. S129]
MPIVSNRRAFLAGLTAILTSARAQAAEPVSADAVKRANDEIAALEAREGGRLGVAVLDSASGLSLAHRAEERFPMCSTFKLLAAAAVLSRVDAGSEQLDRKVPYGAADLLEYAPVTKAHLADGGMSVGDLCAAAIDWSDNTAANLLLQIIGGPAGFTGYARSLGDSVTRLDRNEPTLNTSIPGDERDTTTPLAMARAMQAVLLDKKLSEASRRQLEAWLMGDKVGDKRIRAGLPPSWRIGDKTGSGDNGSTNAIAIIWPPDRAPLLATVYYTGSTASVDARNGVHKDIGAIIAKTF